MLQEKSLKFLRYDQSGRITAFLVIIVAMLIIVIYEFGLIYADWNRINLISVNITVNDEDRSPIPGVSIKVDGELVGETNGLGKITALISKPDRLNLSARKRPFNDIDTTVSVDETSSDIFLLMKRPFSVVTISVVDKSGDPLSNVEVSSSKGKIGETDEEGRISTADAFHLLDSVYVKLSKKGYKDLSQALVLNEPEQTASFTLAKEAAPTPKPPPSRPPSPPASNFQTHFDQANRDLDRAIGGESKYFGRALNEIDKALALRPGYQLASQLKVEILLNFARSLRDSNLLYEAANRCGEALKVYDHIPQDHLYLEVQKLKSEIDKELK
jgi:hypothetical protein